MATKAPVTKAATSTALAKQEAANLAELNEFFDSVSTDGMEDIEGEDIALPVKVYNIGGLREDGSPRPRNIFLDTMSEEEQSEIECVLLLTQKANRWSEWNDAKKQTETHCASDDRKQGVRRLPLEKAGEVRECEGCPDKQWRNDKDGKATKLCGEVHTVVAYEVDNGKPFLIRFKKTGLKPFRSYVMANHWSSRKDKDGNTKNVPLFAYYCTIKLAMHTDGNYAIPALEKGEMLDKETMKVMYENALAYREIMGKVVAHMDKAEEKHGGAEKDPGMNSDDFADDGAG